MSQEKQHSYHPNGAHPDDQPDLEVVPKAKRRTFSAAYKQRILEEVDQCKQPGQIGAVLRRENEKLRRQLAQADLIIAAQKKLAQALEQLTQNKDETS